MLKKKMTCFLLMVVAILILGGCSNPKPTAEMPTATAVVKETPKVEPTAEKKVELHRTYANWSPKRNEV